MSTATSVLESEQPNPVKRRRWIKVDVEEDVFDDLHLKAAESRMRIQPYLRRFLSEARSYAEPSDNAGALSFSSGISGR